MQQLHSRHNTMVVLRALRVCRNLDVGTMFFCFPHPVFLSFSSRLCYFFPSPLRALTFPLHPVFFFPLNLSAGSVPVYFFPYSVYFFLRYVYFFPPSVFFFPWPVSCFPCSDVHSISLLPGWPGSGRRGPVDVRIFAVVAFLGCWTYAFLVRGRAGGW